MGELPPARDYVNVHRVDAVCPHCDRWQELDLAALVAAGHGDIPLIQLPFAMLRVWPGGAPDQGQAAGLTDWRIRTTSAGSSWPGTLWRALRPRGPAPAPAASTPCPLACAGRSGAL
jgi:hypothetical protein